jgi:hypothetical protein
MPKETRPEECKDPKSDKSSFDTITRLLKEKLKHSNFKNKPFKTK